MTGTAEQQKKRADFLEALGNQGNVVQACEATGVGRTTVYRWRKEDDDFAKAWDEAFGLGIEALEAEALRRAFAGSDTLLIFLLKGNKPDRYKDRVASELSGPNGAPIAVDDATAADKLATIIAAAASRRAQGEDLA